MRRARDQQIPDPIAPHAERLISYMNTHPDTLLGYAKYYGGYEDAISARMTDINSVGFVMSVKTSNGKESEVNVRYKNQLKSYEQVRPVLTQMAVEAEEALGLPSTRPPSLNHTPFNPPSPMRCLLILTLIGWNALLVYYPEPLPSFLERARSFFGYEILKFSIHFTVGAHFLEAIIIAIILYRRGEPDLITSVKWISTTLILGHFWQIFYTNKTTLPLKNN